MSLLTEYQTAHNDLGHRNHMPANVRDMGVQIAHGLADYMNNCQIADCLDITESTVRRWRTITPTQTKDVTA